MSVLSYRTWDTWINTRHFTSNVVHRGYYECTIIQSLMAHQTVEFLAEKFEIRDGNFVSIQIGPPASVQQSITSGDGFLCIKLYDELDTNDELEKEIERVISFIETISLCVDFSLSCSKLRFISHQHGKLMVANRRPIGRGVGFEVGDRGKAGQKLNDDFDYFLDNSESSFVVGRRHYLAGMQLLALEDMVSGLLDAAFMQFYQGCEVLCQDPRGNLEESKKYIATLQTNDVRELQIIAHQVWRVRNKYFGHGDVSRNLFANRNFGSIEEVAKQVMVVRYLCRRLIDANSPSGSQLVREMGFYFNNYSGLFNGTINELENNFKVPFDRRSSKIYDSNGDHVDDYEIR